MSSYSPIKIQEWASQLRAIVYQILWRTPEFLTGLFNDLSQNHRAQFNDQAQSKSLLEAGRFAIQSESWDRLGEVNRGLINLLPRSTQQQVQTKIGF